MYSEQKRKQCTLQYILEHLASEKQVPRTLASLTGRDVVRGRAREREMHETGEKKQPARGMPW